MQYLCLVYHEAAASDALPASERETLAGEARAYREELRRSGRFLAASASDCAAATTVRVRSGRLLVTDGAWAEAAEHLGAFYLIEARDLNDAILVAARMPPARLGAVEIRPVEASDRG